jgi:hypothetical protein
VVEAVGDALAVSSNELVVIDDGSVDTVAAAVDDAGGAGAGAVSDMVDVDLL